jgi:hypothetical protein
MNSKMLDTYLRRIAQFLDDEQWDEAERHAAGLPHIAVALSNENLNSSCEAYRVWCQEWVRPPADNALYDSWCALSTPDASQFVDGKPFAVLQTLSLSRGLRAGVAYAPKRHPGEPRGIAVNATCQQLIAAFTAWRAGAGHAGSMVALNLAKLGVLR